MHPPVPRRSQETWLACPARSLTDVDTVSPFMPMPTVTRPGLRESWLLVLLEARIP